jgi:hypothetical protein
VGRGLQLLTLLAFSFIRIYATISIGDELLGPQFRPSERLTRCSPDPQDLSSLNGSQGWLWRRYMGGVLDTLFNEWAVKHN